MISSFKNVLKGLALDYFLFSGFVVSVCIAYLLRFVTIDLLFISKFLVFEVES